MILHCKINLLGFPFTYLIPNIKVHLVLNKMMSAFKIHAEAD